MDALTFQSARPSRFRLLLEHFSRIEDKRSPEDVAHKLNEILLLCVCAAIAECDSFDAISDWGKAHLGFLQRFLPSGRWLNIMMNRIDPDLFAACFMDWVRACWPDPLDTIAIDGKTVRRSHDRSKGRSALHLVSGMARQSGWERRVNQDEKKQPGAVMIVAEGVLGKGLIDAERQTGCREARQSGACRVPLALCERVAGRGFACGRAPPLCTS